MENISSQSSTATATADPIATRKRCHVTSESNSKLENGRLYSMVTIEENGKRTKCVVPIIWVDFDEQTVYWPPKGKRSDGYYIAKWVEPNASWREYKLIKVCIEKGTKEMCKQWMEFDSESSSLEIEDKDNSKLGLQYKRQESPKIKISRKLQPGTKFKKPYCRIIAPPQDDDMNHDFSLDNSMDSENSFQSSPVRPFKKKIHASTPRNDEAASSSQTTAEHQGSNSNPHAQPRSTNIFARFGSPPASFLEMDNKRLQYIQLMEMTALRASCEQLKQAVEKLGRRVEPENSAFHIKQANTLVEFDLQERELFNKEQYNLMVRRLKQLGGASTSASVIRALDETMSKELQSKFNKAGKNGKRAIKKTMLYKSILSALVSEHSKKEEIDRFVGDHLKRAPRVFKSRQDDENNE